MAIGDNAARESRATAWASDYATATLTILDGATTLATHTLAGFTASSVGVRTANAIASAAIAATGTAGSATIVDTAGTYTLTVGLPGSDADVIIDTLSFVFGGTSNINSVVVTFTEQS